MSRLLSFEPGGSEEPHFDRMYLGSVGSRIKAARSVLEGALSVRVECNQIPVYSSPRVCVAVTPSQFGPTHEVSMRTYLVQS